MDRYIILSPRHGGSFTQRMAEVTDMLHAHLTDEASNGRRLHYSKVFLSDIRNQYQQLIESDLYQNMLSQAANTIVEQPPISGCKIALLVKTAEQEPAFIFQSLRLKDEEAFGNSSYLQTMLLFENYLKGIKERGLNMAEHLVRTWIYVADIDVNYAGVVKARNDIFARYGLTADTHFIASTGIGLSLIHI